MDVKLTLKLDEEIIKKAKLFAADNNTSLSRMIENYLLQITSESTTETKVTTLVKSLSGIIDSELVGDYKKQTTDHLIQKLS
ncbi:DUF6364 family protein [Cytophaga aurantiaca]|uniref:DUF6364 family protein n=1 Tax=Cytophaga aurantiaca TaxID=29530 RepID=UPI000374C085|nr:DUF6364 family protein [Cytophaga aurantiaca]